MNEYEERVIGLAQELFEGLRDMLDGDRLTEAKIPDDYQWLNKQIVEMAEAIGEMKFHEDD